MPLLLAGMAVCLQWQQLISSYKDLVGFRIKELKGIEKSEEMANSAQMYHAEAQTLYPSDDPGKIHSSKGLNLSSIEQLLPWVFFALYAASFVGVLVLLTQNSR